VKHTTTPYTPKQISVIERKNQTLVENVQCVLQQMKLEHILWVKTMATITYIQNRIATKSISSMLVEEVWCGYKPSKNHLHVFCCVTFFHVPKEIRTKLDSKGVKCIIISYYEEIKGVKGFFIPSNKIKLNSYFASFKLLTNVNMLVLFQI
jgi:hypothetical protein